MAGMTEQQLDDFCAKLKDFRETLSEQEKQLFEAVLRIAWQAGAKDEALAAGFDGCFTPEEADAIQQYHLGQVDVFLGMIRGTMIRGSGSGLICG